MKTLNVFQCSLRSYFNFFFFLDFYCLIAPMLKRVVEKVYYTQLDFNLLERG